MSTFVDVKKGETVVDGESAMAEKRFLGLLELRVDSHNEFDVS